MKIRYIIGIATLVAMPLDAVAQQEDSVMVQTDSIVPLRCDTVKVVPLTKNVDRPFDVTNGLDGHHVAVWGSHGLYYELGNARWEWQRGRMFNTVEDKFPSSFVINYLAPMLERAGAVVLMPRERDANPEMVVVDDPLQHHQGGVKSTGKYEEHNGKHAWQTGEGRGFAYLHEVYKDMQNPFEDGTYRVAQTVQDEHSASRVIWMPDIKKTGRYAVYVSYKTVDGSVSDAKYIVYHKDGKTTVSVNQQMCGGTWVYIGTFGFDKGTQGKVVLTNVSDSDGVVTADAVRFGGGMGNIARKADGTLVYDNTKKKKGDATVHRRGQYEPVLDTDYEVSGFPRYCEGARYYLQWAGMPKEVYSESDGMNDYVDDYRSRKLWVNYLAGGSAMIPDSVGLRVPLDLSLAFHTDAGDAPGDKIIGTLGIYKTQENNGKLGDGSSRSACRDLTTSIYNCIMNDVRKQMEPRWVGRNCVDRGYAEAATLVPAMLLELLSHANLGDMKYGNDPRFKFLVSRAIYKGMLKFVSKRYGYDYIVAPLPVADMASKLTDGNKVELSWKGIIDPLEKTAVADRYVVYKRIGDGDFDNGTVCEDTVYTCEVPKDKVVSFKVTAVNNGGESMDSEVVSVGISSHSSRQPVLVINGFDRIGAPDDFASTNDKLAGLLDDEDAGVPDGYDISYVGRQKEFRRSVKMEDDDSPGFGASTAEYEKWIVAGNTHDYAAVHGSSIMKAGMSFVSINRGAVKDIVALATDSVHSLNQMYSGIDVILGKEKQSKLGRKGASALQYKTFDNDMQTLLTAYCQNGGSVFVSGSYVASDLWANALTKAVDSDKKFAQNILKYKWRDGRAATEGKVRYVASPLVEKGNSKSDVGYWNEVNPHSYVVESPDAIIPAESAAVTAMRYSENGLGAAVVFGGNSKDHWRTVVMAFPFESIKEEKDRDVMMNNVIKYLVR